jgi:hypothetical protein
MSIRSSFVIFLSLVSLLVLAAQEREGLANADQIRRVVDRASFEFSNESMYRDQKKWIGVTIAFSGAFQLRTDVLNAEKPYQQVRGQNANNDLVDVIVFADSPVLTSQDYGQLQVSPGRRERGSGVSQGEQVRVIGIIQKCREVITRAGVVKVLPVLDLLVVFRLEDQEFRSPLWVSRDLRR